MVTHITPLKYGDGTGRDTYIHHEEFFRSGKSQGPVKWKPALRDPSPRHLPHTKGHQHWYRASSRPSQYSPTVTHPSLTPRMTPRSTSTPRQWVPVPHSVSLRNAGSMGLASSR
mmetsp:Transcript_19278/g.54460  ORF Transcript_19278/g.54460 Transcript_19278/m.54460 type:complete len:114 (-) Transcript_19278:74-415(-)